MVQTLFGYSASDAGWALAPGAMIVVVMAPMVVKLVPIIGSQRMIFFSFLVQGIAMWMYTNSDLTSDYTSFVIPRLVQGFGMAFLFVPVSQVAYSYLPRSANDRASSLTNLFRNLGMSFGIAFCTTVQAQRAQWHRAFLSEHLMTTASNLNSQVSSLQSTAIANAGLSAPDAQRFAYAQVNRMLDNQAQMISYDDTFYLLIWFAAAAVVASFFIRPFKPAGGPGGH
jgi:DHA2 family multidrug resistance protein